MLAFLCPRTVQSFLELLLPSAKLHGLYTVYKLFHEREALVAGLRVQRHLFLGLFRQPKAKVGDNAHECVAHKALPSGVYNQHDEASDERSK